MSSHSDNKTKRELDRIRVSNPLLMAAMQETAESYAPLQDVIHQKIALLLLSVAASVHLCPDLYLWVFIGFAAPLLPDLQCSLRGNEVTGVSVQINVAANIGAGKTTSSNYVKLHFNEGTQMVGMAGDIIVHARGSIQGIAIALVKACKANGRAALM